MESLIYEIINLVAQEMPELRTVDEDYGQMENLNNEEDMYPLTFPAVLIDAPDTEWSNASQGCQEGTAWLRVRLILDCYDDTHAGSRTTEGILERHAMCQRLHHLLQGFRPDGKGELVRTKSKFYTWSFGLKVYETTYSCAVEDVIKRTESSSVRPTVRISAAVSGVSPAGSRP